MSRLVALALVCVAIVACHGSVPERDVPVVGTEGRLSNKYVRAAEKSTIAARLIVEAKCAISNKRPPVNLALVVDTSGSMEGKPIEDARAASKALLASLRPKDRIAVVVFHAKTEVLLPSTDLADADVAELTKKLDAMRAQGTTDMAGGLRTGLAEVEKDVLEGGVNRVILLGDGDPNIADPVRELAREAGERNISVTALGLGPDYNETLMGEIAQVSGGTFHYVDDSSKVAGFFQHEVVRLNTTMAKNAHVLFVPGPGVHIASVIGQQASQNGNGLEVSIGDMSSGERREIVVKLEVPARHAGAPVELLDADVEYADGEGKHHESRVFFGAHAIADETQLKAGADDEIEKSVAQAEAAAATLEAINAARKGEMARAHEVLSAAKGSANKAGSSFDFEDALESVSPAAQAPVANPSPMAPQQAKPKPHAAERLKQAHDSATQQLQTK